MEDANLPSHVRRLLSYFPEARRSGAGYLAPCPCASHGNGDGDQHPNLKIDLGHDGRILLNCRVGCSTADCLAAAGLDWSDLFPQNGDEAAAGNAELAVKPLLDPDACHRAYSAVLDALSLSDDQREALRRRGLPDGEIDARGYRTLRNIDRKPAASAASSAVGDTLFNVPGFVQGEYGPTIQGTATGTLVPVRDRYQRVIALKIRRPDGQEPKYVLLTSGSDGPSPTNLVHVPLGVASAAVIRVTEGELKADVSTAIGELPTIGVPGVSQWAPAITALKELGVKTAVVAFDATDVKSMLPIREKCGEFVAALRDNGFAVELEDWDGPHKGIDDLLAAGNQPRRLAGTDVDAHLGATGWGAPALPPQAAPTAPPPTSSIPPAPPASPPVACSRVAFPVSVFPASLATFACKIADSVRCPVEYPAVGMLVVAGAAVGSARAVKVKDGWNEKGSIYAAIVGEPGSAKTPALKHVLKPIYVEQERLFADYKAARKRYEQESEEYAKPKTADPDTPPSVKPVAPPPPRHLFVGDVTTEALAAALERNPKGLLVYRDELAAWVRSMDMYRAKGADTQFFLSAWSSEFVKVDRRQRQDDPISVPHPFIAVLGGIQPDILPDLDVRHGKQDGFLPRLLFAYPPSGGIPRWSDAGIAEDDEEPWRLTVARLLNLQPLTPEGGGPEPRALPLTPAGKDMYVAWYNRLADEMDDRNFPPALVAPWVKMRAYVARFALIIHLLRVACGEAGNEQSEGAIDDEDVRRGIALADYFMSQVRFIYPCLARTVEDRKVEDLVAWMKRQCLTECSARDVNRAEVAGLKKASDAIKVFQEAADRGFGEMQQAPAVLGKGGKRAVRFVLAPFSA